MERVRVTVGGTSGLHAWPAAQFVQAAIPAAEQLIRALDREAIWRAFESPQGSMG